MTRVVWTNVAFEGTLLNHDTRSMVEQSKVGITGPAVEEALVQEYEDVFTGKRSKLSRSQCLCLGRIKIPKVLQFPNVFVPQIHSIGDLEGERVMSTGGPSIGSNHYQRPCCGRNDQFAYRLATTVCRQSKLSGQQ